jgi:hypothetical protein
MRLGASDILLRSQKSCLEKETYWPARFSAAQANHGHSRYGEMNFPASNGLIFPEPAGRQLRTSL